MYGSYDLRIICDPYRNKLYVYFQLTITLEIGKLAINRKKIRSYPAFNSTKIYHFQGQKMLKFIYQAIKF